MALALCNEEKEVIGKYEVSEFLCELADFIINRDN